MYGWEFPPNITVGIEEWELGFKSRPPILVASYSKKEHAWAVTNISDISNAKSL